MILALAAGAIVTLAVVVVLLGVLIVGLAQTEGALRVWARRQRAAAQDPAGSNGKPDSVNAKGPG